MDAKTVLMGIGLLAVVIVALKFGKQLLTLAIVLAVVVALVGIAWLVLQSGLLNSETIGDAADVARLLRPEPEPEPVTTTPVGVYLCIGSAGTLALVALLVAGFFWARWRLEQSRRGQKIHWLPEKDRHIYPVVIDGEPDYLGWDEWGG